MNQRVCQSPPNSGGDIVCTDIACKDWTHRCWHCSTHVADGCGRRCVGCFRARPRLQQLKCIERGCNTLVEVRDRCAVPCKASRLGGRSDPLAQVPIGDDRLYRTCVLHGNKKLTTYPFVEPAPDTRLYAANKLLAKAGYAQVRHPLPLMGLAPMDCLTPACPVQTGTAKVTQLVLASHGTPMPRKLYEAGLIDRADGKPIVNGVRCAWVNGRYRVSGFRETQCHNSSFGHTFCWQHQHCHDIFTRASALLCVFYRGFHTRDGVWKEGGLREVFRGERARATALLARCLLVDPGTLPVVEDGSGAETWSDSEYEPDFVELLTEDSE